MHVLSGLKTSVGVKRGKGGPQGAVKYSYNIQMEAGHLRENPQTPQQQETLQAITLRLQACAFF